MFISTLLNNGRAACWAAELEIPFLISALNEAVVTLLAVLIDSTYTPLDKASHWHFLLSESSASRTQSFTSSFRSSLQLLSPFPSHFVPLHPHPSITPHKSGLQLKKLHGTHSPWKHPQSSPAQSFPSLQDPEQGFGAHPRADGFSVQSAHWPSKHPQFSPAQSKPFSQSPVHGGSTHSSFTQILLGSAQTISSKNPFTHTLQDGISVSSGLHSASGIQAPVESIINPLTHSHSLVSTLYFPFSTQLGIQSPVNWLHVASAQSLSTHCPFLHSRHLFWEFTEPSSHTTHCSSVAL